MGLYGILYSMSKKGNYKKLNNGLTPKENAFKNKIVEQIAKDGEPNGTAAAMEVYDVKSRNVAKSIATEKFSKPAIQDAIEEALKSNGITEDGILKNIHGLAQASPVKLTGETILKANLSLLKFMGHGNDGKKGVNKLTVNNTYINIGYDEAKKKLEQVSGDADQFIQEADVL